MHLNKKRAVIGALCLCVFASGALVGCKKQETKTLRTAKIKSPAIIENGVLKVGVNFGVAPYAVKQGDAVVGFDAEVADLISQKLGLYPEYVQVAPDKVATALANGTVDVVLSADMDTGDALLVGPYYTSGPGFFTASDNALNAESSAKDFRKNLPIGVQKNSISYWYLVDALGESGVKTFSTTKELIAAVASGSVSLGAMDSLVGKYAIAGGSKISFAGFLDGEKKFGVAVAPAQTELGSAISTLLANATDKSIIDSMNRKWISTSTQALSSNK
ncbi:MAG: transporter substrate-binding domain-containing protein [Coriobacteriia bacterium]|nr:transporter substrate-binding domain-containing protein [Coriobacteriia bacterium]